MNPHLQRLSYADVSGIAERLTREQGYHGVFPLDIGKWVEVDLGIEVHPYIGLKQEFGVEGFIGAGLKTLTIDHDLYFEERYTNRCRFTFAHEIGHYYLHNGLYREARFDSPEEYGRFVNSISEEDLYWFELQGFMFAGLLLVPRWALAPLFRERLEQANDQAGQFADAMSDQILAGTIDACAKHFGVSRQTMLKRLEKDKLLSVGTRSFE